MAVAGYLRDRDGRSPTEIQHASCRTQPRPNRSRCAAVARPTAPDARQPAQRDLERVDSGSHQTRRSVCRSRRRVGPRRTGELFPTSRSRSGRRPGSWSAMICGPADPDPSNIVYSSKRSHTAVTAGTSNPPANTAQACSTVCSSVVSRSYDHCTALCKLWCRFHSALRRRQRMEPVVEPCQHFVRGHQPSAPRSARFPTQFRRGGDRSPSLLSCRRRCRG